MKLAQVVKSTLKIILLIALVLAVLPLMFDIVGKVAYERHLERMRESYAVSREKAEKERQNNLPYHPDRCKTDAKGRVYFALGRQVFHVPYQTPLFTEFKRQDSMPSRPDPSEPTGCPGNPLWGESFLFSHGYSADENKKPDPNSNRPPEGLRLMEPESEQLDLQLFYEESFTRRKDTYNTCEALPEGFVACYTPPEDTSLPKAAWGVTYQAAPDVYRAPMDRPFTIFCAPASTLPMQCNVNYRAYDGDLILAYWFYPKDLPISEIIDYDRRLRETVEAMRVKDYRWADEPKTKSSTEDGE
jgi:hypothetical protein